MSSISDSSSAVSYAKEAYGASLAKVAQVDKGQQALDLLESAKVVNPTTPAASSGSHMTTDNLGQSVNIHV
ncbi:hypothetical protein [Marinomonas flavescens]|uniref:hypothetical protein n=1 Tax=Marinomonas flavescens TaxID=2529379 RepID=UPI001054956F|nr:hypothetical protein [Marinomonas flavescens]